MKKKGKAIFVIAKIPKDKTDDLYDDDSAREKEELDQAIDEHIIEGD